MQSPFRPSYIPPPPGPSTMDHYTQAFKTALTGWGCYPDTTGPVPDVPLENRGMKLDAKCIDMRFDHSLLSFVAEERELPSYPTQTGWPLVDPHAEFAFTLHRTLPNICPYKAFFDVRSPLLRRQFEAIIGKVEGVSWTSTPLRIDYRIFIIFRHELEGALKDTGKSSDDAPSYEHLTFFLDFLHKEYAGTISELDSLLEHGEITFDYVWAILKPRSILYTRCDQTNEPCAVRLLEANKLNETAGNSSYWELNVEYVDYNYRNDGLQSSSNTSRGPRAEKYGLVPGMHQQTIGYFNGTRKITSFGIYPMEYYPQLKEMKSLIVARGKKWMTFQGGIHHVQYSNSRSSLGWELESLDTELVMIDREKYNGSVNVIGGPMNFIPQVTKSLSGVILDNIVRLDRPNADDFSDCGDSPIPSKIDEEELTEEELLIANPRLYGYNINSKRWVTVGVDSVGPIEWNDEPFNNLVLSGNQKALIKALVEAHDASRTASRLGCYARFDDFVQGKGQGLVINLFGNPGVGKTLTAEATSQHVKKPLMVVGAADLGTSADSAEDRLQWAFNHASRWGAIVLIDEADVFLEARSLHDLERNALVSVFLRQLEYFRGILFLTTNRVRTIDPAFQSRIHVSLRYRDLSPDARRAIWIAFLTKARGTFTGGAALADFGHGLAERELRLLSAREVNGRQIKNAVRTASALAASMQEQLGYKHLESVLDMMAEFEAEMNAAREEID